MKWTAMETKALTAKLRPEIVKFDAILGFVS